MNESRIICETRSLASIVAEVRQELTEFLSIRLQMMKSELHETLGAFRMAVPLGAITLVLIGTGFLLFSAALVTLVASAFAGNPYAWFYAFVIMGFAWTALGCIAAFFAYNELRSKGMFPKRTLQVLKADKDWLESEARSSYGRAA